MFTISYRYTASLMRRSFLPELWRTHSLWILLLPLVIALAIFWSQDPEYWWLAGFLAGLAFMYVVGLYTSYREGRRFVNQDVKVIISDAGVRFESVSFTSDLLWSGVATARQEKYGVVLTPRISQRPILLPAEALPTEAASFILRKVRESRGA